MKEITGGSADAPALLMKRVFNLFKKGREVK